MTTAPGTLLGYCRVSTTDQHLDAQTDALLAAGVDLSSIWEDKLSGARADRPGLNALLAYAREGDVVVVWRLDRLGRSLSHIVQTVADLRARGIHVRSITDGADSSTSTGRLMIGLLATLAEYERELINERSAVARKAARDRGKHVGRPAALTPDQARQLRALHDAGESVPTLMATFRIGRATAYRALKNKEALAAS